MARDQQVAEALERTASDAIAPIVGEVLEQARGPYQAAAALASSPNADIEDKARCAFDEASHVGVAPLMDAMGLSPEGRAWQIAVIAESAGDLRRDVLRWLLELLRDRTPLAKGSKVRVCDEAFLLLRDLAPVPENHPAKKLDRSAFLALPAWKRDTLAREVQKAPSVRRALGHRE
jgi:hypothetical protein